MAEDIKSQYEVMVAASNMLKEAADTAGLGNRDFQSEAALEDAIPMPTTDQLASGSLSAAHQAIAASVRGPYRVTLTAVEAFTNELEEKITDIGVNVQKSADEYLERERRNVEEFQRIDPGQ